ncbi:MAG: ADP-dependent NAD(P)H-hydrate dehydratase [Rhodoglobus sp.]
MGIAAVWSAREAAACIAVPGMHDDKYSRGVLGIITGSTRYPGAAVIGVEAALRTGVGMVRFLGPPQLSDLVLRQRPEAVTTEGRVQAWLMGSGMDPGEPENWARLIEAVKQPVPVILDGGALELHHHALGQVVITPHYGELARLLGIDRRDLAASPEAWARRTADELGVTVVLKGHDTYIAGPEIALSASTAPTWLATAGAGDALAGILGSLLATHAQEIADDPTELARLAATAAVLHGLAAERASGGGPLTVLDVTAALPATIAMLLSELRSSI